MSCSRNRSDRTVDVRGLSLEDDDMMVEEEDVSEIPPPSSEPPKPKRKNQSMVWSSFTKKYVGDPPRPRAFCNYCEADYAADGNKNGTKNLLDHLSKCKKNPNKLPSKPDKRQKTLAYEKGVEGDENPSNLVLAKKFDHNHAIALRQALAEFLIVDELPFRIVESPQFRKLLRMLEPRFQVPSRMTIARTCIDIFKDQKAWLKSMIKACDSRVCLTTDAWTSIQNLSYMVVTAHWIDKEWKLQKRVISFRLIDNHKGDTIGAQVEECLHDWGIDKIMTITVDNASSNDTAIGYLKRHLRSNVLNGLYIHMRCAAHIMNLVVGDGLKINDDAITRVRDAIRYVFFFLIS